MIAPLQLVVFGTPRPKGSQRVITKGKGGRKLDRPIVATQSKEAISWQQEIARVALVEMRGREPWLDGELSVSLVFALARPKGHYGTGRNSDAIKPSAPKVPTGAPDVDKLARVVLDALTGIVWRDDAQVASLLASKVYAPPGLPTGVFVEVGGYVRVYAEAYAHAVQATARLKAVAGGIS